MASKLRRTPLFGYDGNLGIPIMPKSGANPTTTPTASANVGRPQKFDYQVSINNNPIRGGRRATTVMYVKEVEINFILWFGERRILMDK